jgi:hypothetical protein
MAMNPVGEAIRRALAAATDAPCSYSGHASPAAAECRRQGAHATPECARQGKCQRADGNLLLATHGIQHFAHDGWHEV